VAESIKVGATASSRANPAAVFLLLKNSDTWPLWSMFDSAVLERAGDDGPYGVGAVRSFSTRISKATEQVTKLIPNRQLSYVLLSGLPLRNYRADVVLTPSGVRGTLISWTASFQCAYGTGWFWRMFMNRILSDMATRLAKAAAESAASETS
jgi:Polyketide cyclase / dehydrase and lipid transport